MSRAEKGLEEVKIAVAEAREAVEQRRHLILRNNVDEEDLDVNVVNDRGDYRLVLFTLLKFRTMDLCSVMDSGFSSVPVTQRTKHWRLL